jgi:fructoselysine 6-kinase
MTDLRVAAIGDNCIDVYPSLGKAYPTGNAVDFAVNIHRLGIATSMVGTTGNDLNGEWMVEALTREGLDLGHFVMADGATAVAYLDMDGQECLHVRYEEGVLSEVRYTDHQISFAASHDLVHSTPWGHVDPYLARLKSRGALLSFDYSFKIDGPGVKASLPYVDYAFFSLRGREAEAEDVLRAMAQSGPRVAVGTLGPRGSLAWDGTRLHRQGSISAQVVNTVGGGDSFIAGFMNAALRGDPVDDCLDAGARVAARVVGVFGPWEGAHIERPRIDTLDEWSEAQQVRP